MKSVLAFIPKALFASTRFSKRGFSSKHVPHIDLITKETLPQATNYSYPLLTREQRLNLARREANLLLRTLVLRTSAHELHCESVLAMSEKQCAQLYADEAEEIVERVNKNICPTPWSKPHLSGLTKHTVVGLLNQHDSDFLNRQNFISEICYYKGLPHHGHGMPQHATRLDLLTHPLMAAKTGITTIWEYKFGKKGISSKQLMGFLNHGPQHSIVNEVRPSHKGGIKTKFIP